MASDAKCINTIRCFCADMVQGPKSGHPGCAMGMAPVAHMLWSKYMNFDASDPNWINRDRFVLSNGHGCTLQYTLLHLMGLPYPIEALKKFRKVGSIVPGHPERLPECPGVEVSTGPLGQGISQAVGLALAQEHLAARFNKPGFQLLDNYTYVFCGDGCLQEGVSCESTSLAGHLGLGRLIVIYDDNDITIDGPTSLSFSDKTGDKFKALGWHVVTVADGNTTDTAEMEKALLECRNETKRPSMIVLKTVIGYGSNIQGTAKVHGTPLGDDDIKQLKTKFGLDPEAKYSIGEDVYKVYAAAAARGSAKSKEWAKMFSDYANAHKDAHKELSLYLSGSLPDGWQNCLPKSEPGKAIPTRKCSEVVLNALMPVVGNIIGGSADLTPSNLTKAKGAEDVKSGSYGGRYIRFGVREHGMSAIGNGIACYGGLIPFVATFYNFIGYAWGAVRLGAFSNCGTIYIATHDSIGVGEDGPTHQPVELPSLCRATPNLLFFRPCDQTETSGAYAVALERRSTTHVLAFSRQNTPGLARSSMDGVRRGAYVVYGPPPGGADLIIASTGSEVGISIDAAKILEADLAVTVVSMPCWELFEEQDALYKASVFSPGKPVLGVEAYVGVGWERYCHYFHGMTSFGASGPAGDVYKHFGMTKEVVAEKGRKLVVHFAGGPAPTKIPVSL